MAKRSRSLVFYFFLLAVLLSITALSGCSQSRRGLLDYQSGELELSLKAKTDELEFSAILCLGEMTDLGTRDLALTVTAPDTLKGIVFTKSSDGSLAVEYNGLTLDVSGDSTVVHKISELFCINEKPLAVSAVLGADEGLSKYDFLTRLEFSDAVVFLDNTTDTPVKLVSDGIELVITSFENKKG